MSKIRLLLLYKTKTHLESKNKHISMNIFMSLLHIPKHLNNAHVKKLLFVISSYKNIVLSSEAP